MNYFIQESSAINIVFALKVFKSHDTDSISHNYEYLTILLKVIIR